MASFPVKIGCYQHDITVTVHSSEEMANFYKEHAKCKKVW